MNKIKNIYLSIKYKILITVLVILVLFAVNAIIGYSSLIKSKEVTEEISTVIRPSMLNIGQFELYVNNSKNYINTWNVVDLDNHPDKIALKNLIKKDYPELRIKLLQLSGRWEWDDMRKELEVCLKEMDDIIELDKSIMTSLNSFDSYMDIMVKMEIDPVLEEVNAKSMALAERIKKVRSSLQEESDKSESSMIAGFDRMINQSLLFSVIVIAVGLTLGFLLSINIVRPVIALKDLIVRLCQGELPDLSMKVQQDEIGDMVASMEVFIKELRKTSVFASEVGQGKFDSEFNALSDKDVLGMALLDMRNNLNAAQEEQEKHQLEEQHKQWFVTGVAKFSEILRDGNTDLKKMTKKYLRELSKYVDVQQATMYITNHTNDDNRLELLATYGCDSKLLEVKELEVGEGLAGQVFKDNKAVVLEEIPNDFTHNYKILSGLGETVPSSLVILPIKDDKNIVGVIELSSYQPIEKRKVEFLEDVISSLAATISSVQLNERTQILLAESKEQAIRIQQSEEEMRQNMEEMRAVQEQMESREQDLQRELEEYKAKLTEKE